MQPINEKRAAEIAADCFVSNKNINECFIAIDGNAFATIDDLHNHQKTLMLHKKFDQETAGEAWAFKRAELTKEIEKAQAEADARDEVKADVKAKESENESKIKDKYIAELEAKLKAKDEAESKAKAEAKTEASENSGGNTSEAGTTEAEASETGKTDKKTAKK